MALAGVTLGTLVVFAFVVLLGDTRQMTVLLATPEEGSTTASTVRSVTLTFSAEPDRESIQEHLRIEPAADGTIRWRGSVMEYLFTQRLEPGEHRLIIAAGAKGRAGEPLEEDYVLAWTVREPGIALVTFDDTGEKLELRRDGEGTRELYRADRIIDFSVSPDGSRVAIVAEDEPPAPNVVPASRLVLVDPTTGESEAVVDSEQLTIGAVSWSADSQFLLVIRREKLPAGGEGVPRAWVMRLSGEFIQPVDIDGQPSISASWSPDGQWVGYVAPASATLVAWNIASQETRVLGQPRSTTVSWSPDSRLVAFESVPPSEQPGTTPLQPIAVRSLDFSVRFELGATGETRSYPRFAGDGAVVMSVRRVIGERLRTDLVFESVENGSLLRAVQLSNDSALVTGWDLDPAERRVLFVRRLGSGSEVMLLDLETLELTPVADRALDAAWLP